MIKERAGSMSTSHLPVERKRRISYPAHPCIADALHVPAAMEIEAWIQLDTKFHYQDIVKTWNKQQTCFLNDNEKQTVMTSDARETAGVIQSDKVA